MTSTRKREFSLFYFLKFMNQIFMSVPASFPTVLPHFGQRGCLTVATVGRALQWGVAHFENASPYDTFGNEITVLPFC
jgi:hypothetical protein